MSQRVPEQARCPSVSQPDNVCARARARKRTGSRWDTGTHMGGRLQTNGREGQRGAGGMTDPTIRRDPHERAMEHRADAIDAMADPDDFGSTSRSNPHWCTSCSRSRRAWRKSPTRSAPSRARSPCQRRRSTCRPSAHVPRCRARRERASQHPASRITCADREHDDCERRPSREPPVANPQAGDARPVTGAVLVARPSRWGNPFKVGEYGTAAECVTAYEQYLLWHRPDLLAQIPQLRGQLLACYCPLDQPCHGDVLARMANEIRERRPRRRGNATSGPNPRAT